MSPELLKDLVGIVGSSDLTLLRNLEIFIDRVIRVEREAAKAETEIRDRTKREPGAL